MQSNRLEAIVVGYSDHSEQESTLYIYMGVSARERLRASVPPFLLQALSSLFSTF